jgi:hypothetical protein
MAMSLNCAHGVVTALLLAPVLYYLTIQKFFRLKRHPRRLDSIEISGSLLAVHILGISSEVSQLNFRKLSHDRLRNGMREVKTDPACYRWYGETVSHMWLEPNSNSTVLRH